MNYLVGQDFLQKEKRRQIDLRDKWLMTPLDFLIWEGSKGGLEPFVQVVNPYVKPAGFQPY
jgi:hypothetical protein